MIKKWQTIAGLIVALIVIGTSGYKFWDCKANKVQVREVASSLYIYKLEDYRRYIQTRIYDLMRIYPNNYQNMREYQSLVNELRKVDVKINAYYQKGGR